MKSIVSVIVLSLFGYIACFAQVQTNDFIIDANTKQDKASNPLIQINTKGLSPSTAFILMEQKMREKKGGYISIQDSTLIKKYGLVYQNGEIYASAFLILSDETADISEILSFGAEINTRINNIVTAMIPINQIENIANHQNIIYVQIGEIADITMDEAKSATWVNWVHQGNQLPQSYFGTGVVIGVIDIGFDYTHPNFYDNTGSNNYRVQRIWEQNNTGTPPSGFSYGRELSNQTDILNAQRDIPDASHGTHVAGIAAGAGGGANTDFMGVAPQSDLVFVSTNASNTGIADGIAYIMNYANSVNKPCVINMSLGIHTGPHDGTSVLDQYCDGVVGQGKLLVGSAGNDGLDSLYLAKSYTLSDTLLFTFLKFSNATFPTKNNGSGSVDIWGNPNQNFWVAVTIWNSNTNQFEDWTPYISANSNNTSSYTLFDNDGDNLLVNISAEISPLNNKPNIRVEVDNSAQDDNYRWVLLEIIAYNTQTKMWGGPNNTKATFTSLNYAYPVVSGSTSSTMREIGGTGNSIISVGAYTSKNTWTALNGSTQYSAFNTSNGVIAPFSSKGPTADNRTKPDITAPGNVIASSVSRFDNSYNISSNSVVSGVTDGTNTWLFATMPGTSMASPMVTGILALWLQAYPNLTPTQAKNLLIDNAWTDSYTGTIPANGNNTWGWGKVDAHEGLLDLLTKIPAQPTINPSGNVAFCQGQNAQLSAPIGFSSYQWSNSATTQNISVSTGGNYTVRVTNSQGYISPWSAPKNVTVHSIPPTPNITINGNVLTSSSTTGNQWYLNGNIIAGATQQNYTAQQNGNYHVVVTNTNNCSAQSNTFAFTIVGIADIERVGVTSVYPNPTNGLLNIQFSENQQDIQLEIYDVSGRVHIQKRVMTISQNSIETLNLNNLTTGVYTLRILTIENQATFRIVVTK